MMPKSKIRRLAESIRRPEPSRETRKAILIATEDQKSSRKYFQRFRDELRLSMTVVLADYVGSAPDSVVSAARAAKEERERQAELGLEPVFDEVWVVFDTEGPQNIQRHREAKQAIERARHLNFKTAVSNPCFEFWCILHFEFSVEPLVDGKAACSRLKRHISGYKKNSDIFDELRPDTETAIKHSGRVWRERYFADTHPCSCHPSTEVHKLVQTLLKQQ